MPCVTNSTDPLTRTPYYGRGSNPSPSPIVTKISYVILRYWKNVSLFSSCAICQRPPLGTPVITISRRYCPLLRDTEKTILLLERDKQLSINYILVSLDDVKVSSYLELIRF